MRRQDLRAPAAPAARSDPAARTDPAARSVPALRTVAVVLDVVLLLVGTFGVWLLLGLAGLDAEVADWLPPAVVATGAVTATMTAAVAVRTWRGRPVRGLARGVMALHLVLAGCTGALLHEPVGVAALLVGALVVAWVGSAPDPQEAPARSEPVLHRPFRGA